MPLDVEIPIKTKKTKLYIYNPAKDPKEITIEMDISKMKYNSENNYTNQDTQDKPVKKYLTVKEKIETISKLENEIPKIVLSEKDKAILKKLELEHEKNIKSQNMKDEDVSNESKIDAEVIKIENTKITSNSPQVKLKPSVRPKKTVKSFIFLYYI